MVLGGATLIGFPVVCEWKFAFPSINSVDNAFITFLKLLQITTAPLSHILRGQGTPIGVVVLYGTALIGVALVCEWKATFLAFSGVHNTPVTLFIFLQLTAPPFPYILSCEGTPVIMVVSSGTGLIGNSLVSKWQLTSLSFCSVDKTVITFLVFFHVTFTPIPSKISSQGTPVLSMASGSTAVIELVLVSKWKPTSLPLSSMHNTFLTFLLIFQITFSPDRVPG